MNLPAEKRPRILYVEDNLVVAAAYEKLLADIGCEVVHCQDGEAASDRLKTGRFDLLLLDLMLPGEEDGIGVVKHAQLELWKHKTPTIVLTLVNLPAVHDELKKQGVTCILDKRTTKPAEVVEAVLNALIGAEKPVDTGIKLAEGERLADRKSTQVYEDELSAIQGEQHGKKGLFGRIFHKGRRLH